MMNEEMSKEKKLIIYCSRLTMQKEEEEIKNLLAANDICWEKVIEYGMRNKVLYLVEYHLERLGVGCMPKYFQNLISDGFACNQIRNDLKLSEMRRVCSRMLEAGIKIVPVKGAFLIDHLYKNRRIRITNDMDALIRRDDIPGIHQIMLELGYVNDYYDREKKTFTEYSRQKKMLYKTKMYNLLPYVKVVPDALDTVIMFDFSFALDFTRDINPVQEMIACADEKNQIGILKKEHFFVHMCCHHYREASHTEWIKLGKDLNFIKFCDVREFVLRFMDEESMNHAIAFAEKYHLKKAVFFTLYFLNEIYHDGYENSIMDKLDIDRPEFLFEFGENEYTQVQTRKKEFWDSFFDENNISEITEVPKYEEII